MLEEFWRRRLIPDFLRSSESTKHNGKAPGPSAPHIAATYRYEDESGDLLYEVVRYEPKAFKQRRPDGRSGFIWNLEGARRVLYRLPELIEAASAEQIIFLVEGEKDVDNLRKLNILATTCSGGAKKWRPEYSEFLRGCNVVLTPDNDDTGRAHMGTVAASLRGVADSIRILKLPSLPPSGDVSDWLKAGGTVEALWRIVDATPQWMPAEIERPKATFGLVTVCAAAIIPERISWLWPGRLARGKHTTFAGDPGGGKSQILIWIAAAITTGGPWPCGEGTAPLGNVVLLCAEDGAADTVVPRLLAAGADLNRIHLVNGTVDANGQRTFNLQADLDLLEREIKRIREEKGEVYLVGIDPVTAYMGFGVDDHKNVAVRRVLSPITDLAERTKAAVASITHFNKSANSTKALHRFIGSIAFTAAPRIALVVTEDPDDPTRHLLLHGKNNLAKPPQGLAFRLEQRLITDPRVEDEILASSVVWESASVATAADEALGAGGKYEPTATDANVEFLRTVLDEAPAKVEVITAEARAAGLLKADQPINKDKPFREAKRPSGLSHTSQKAKRAPVGIGHFRSIRRPRRYQAPPKITGRLTGRVAPDRPCCGVSATGAVAATPPFAT